jgi:hypothetical protein
MRTFLIATLLIAGVAALLIGSSFLIDLPFSRFDHTSMAVCGALLVCTGAASLLYVRKLSPASPAVSLHAAALYILVVVLTLAALGIPDLAGC